MNWFQFKERFPHWKPNCYLYAVSGEASFRDDAVADIRARHRPSDLDYVRVRARSEAAVLSYLEAEPTRGHRLVEVSDFDTWGNRMFLTEWMKSRKQPNIVVIFVSESSSPSTKNEFAQFIISKGWWVVCTRPSQQNMKDYLMRIGNLRDGPAERLVELAGTDLQRARNILLKVGLLGIKYPSIDDIENASVGTTSSVMLAVDSFISGRKLRTLELLSDDRLSQFLTLLRKRLEQLMIVRAGLKRNDSVQEIAQSSGIPLFLVAGAIGQAKTVTVDKAMGILTRISQIEAGSFKGQDLGLLVTRLIMEA